MAKIEDGEIIEGGIACPNCGDEMSADSNGRLFCETCGYSEAR